jgi:hypothetical protein
MSLEENNSSLIFITVFNYGGIQLALNHYKSLTMVGIQNYMAYVTDEESVKVMQENGYNVTFIENAAVDKNKLDFCTGDFNKLSYLRYHVASSLIRAGNYVWYMDIDTVILQDVRPVYKCYKADKFDMVLQNDINMPCSGCVLYMASPDTAKIAEIVIDVKDNFPNDQICLFNVLQNAQSLYDEKFLKNIFKFDLFNINHFPNGLLFFDDDFVTTMHQHQKIKQQYRNSNEKPYFVHANWMIGNEKKIAAFKQKGLWFI